MTVQITTTEQQMLRDIHAKADELCRMIGEANNLGFNVTFNLNPLVGACDRFDVHKMVAIDLKGGAN